MKFLCDAMLGHLGRKLRMAGYDTRIDKGLLTDGDLSQLALSEERILLTCDAGFQTADPHLNYIHLFSNDESEWAKVLAAKLGVNWTLHPFTRCLECNTELRTASDELIKRIPPNSRHHKDEALYCPACDKVYWFGSHVARMLRQLEAFKGLPPP